MIDDTPLHALILTTLLPADLEALCLSLRAFATVAGGTSVHVALLVEPLDVATLQAWLAADGRVVHKTEVIDDTPRVPPKRRYWPPLA